MKPIHLLYRQLPAVHIINAGSAVFIRRNVFRMAPLREWEEDLKELSSYQPTARRIF